MAKNQLPSIQTMYALEAAVRLRSFTAAADQLALSQGAISQHIRALEKRVGRSLFVRTATGVEPSPVAHALALQIRQGLAVLDRAFDQIPKRVSGNRVSTKRQRLVVSVLPAFAARWLLPRIDLFAQLHPEIDLEIQTSGTPARLDATDGVDLAIRYGAGTWQGMAAEHLMDEVVFPVASPNYRDGDLPKLPIDLRDCVLLRHSAQHWSPWFQVAGLTLLEPQKGVMFADISLAIEAAVAGRGIALARRSIVQDELTAGRLVRLWTHEMLDVHSHYLVWPVTSRRFETISKFRVWLIEQVRLWRASLDTA